MKNKVYTFGFLAAALIIAPSAAFANQSQGSSQNMNQVTVINGSGNSTRTSGTQITNQGQSKSGICNYGSQVQSAVQNLNQVAVVNGYNNKVDIDALQRTVQAQVNAARYCY
ncbi:MAG: hypothetical protein IGS39_20295 [Calothrix sp. C42_A2020_038]|nr:hypothetical protein [Calothrix sp. C42_A2020_038]